MSGGRRDVWLGWALVAAQFALLAALAREFARARAHRGPAAFAGVAAGAAGIVVAGLGAAELREHLTAHPAPTTNAVLLTTGVYGRARHPIYSGLLLAGAGAMLLARTSGAVSALAALVLLFNVKSRFEERLLAARFPAYPAYARRVPRFIPRP